MQLYLHPDLKQYFDGASSIFDQMMALKGEVYRSQKGRLTQRITLGDKTYYLKQHHGVGWKEIIKNLCFGRLPVLGARNEVQALQTLAGLGINAPHVIAYGERGINPARRKSFVLLEDIHPAISLEDLGKQWQQQPPHPVAKRKLIEHVAAIARSMHQHGINHRDFYICHFLMKEEASLYLIDLHRAQIRQRTPLRWVIKDLAGLYFSSMELGLTKRDYYRFIKMYEDKPLRDVFTKARTFWHKVKQRGERLYRNHQA